MWIDVSTSSFTRRSREHDRVLEVVTLPRHERHEQVLAERELAEVRRRAVGEHVALLDLRRRSSTIGFWLMHVPWFERRNLASRCVTRPPFLYSTVTVSPDDVDDRAVVGREQHVAGVACGARLDTGADVRRGRPQQRDGLALHVGAHERAVGVVVLEERDERGRDRDDLLRRHVHVVDLARRST